MALLEAARTKALEIELRAAREIVQAARMHRQAWEQPGRRTCSCAVCSALASYEVVVRALPDPLAKET